jgi:hypothetical protein
MTTWRKCYLLIMHLLIALMHYIMCKVCQPIYIPCTTGQKDSIPPKDMKREWSNALKPDGLKETIKSTEAAKIDALKDYESIKVNRLKTCCICIQEK